MFNEKRALKAGAPTLFEANVFDADFYTASEEAKSTPQKRLLGKRLFYDNRLSGDKKRSCASCHQPCKAFADGMITNLSADGKHKLLRNTPTLLNAALQPSLFYDIRVSYLEDQVKEVIDSRDEMHGSLKEALVWIKSDAIYDSLFQSTFGRQPVTDWHIKNSLAAYVRSLLSLNAPFDQYMRGTAAALNNSEKNGFNLFVGKAKCGTCHFVPLFNGVAPPNFTKAEAEIIGVPADASNTRLDKDEGKYALYKIPCTSMPLKHQRLETLRLPHLICTMAFMKPWKKW